MLRHTDRLKGRMSLTFSEKDFLPPCAAPRSGVAPLRKNCCSPGKSWAWGILLVLLFIGASVGLCWRARLCGRSRTLKETILSIPINTVWDAGGRLPGVRHASRLHHARSRLLPLSRDRERAHGMYRGHLSLRRAVLRVRLFFHVQPRQWPDRIPLVLPTRRTSNIRNHRRRVFGRLDFPICLRGYLLDHHFWSDDWPHRLSLATFFTVSAVTGFIYPVVGHWAWGPDGWLANMGSDGQCLARPWNGFS